MKLAILKTMAFALVLGAVACDMGPKEGEEYLYYVERLNTKRKKSVKTR